MNMGKKEESFKGKINRLYAILVITIIFVVTTMAVGAVLFRYYLSGYKELAEENIYDKYYVMITDSYKSAFWQAVYDGAVDKAKEENIYVDLLGHELSEEHSCEELMRIAIASKVDGIMVQANESDDMTQLINEAVSSGIPVVTLGNDNTHSGRLSFVGVGSYNIGREYGKQILNIIKEKRREDLIEAEVVQPRNAVQIAVLVSADAQDSGQNLIISALQETLLQQNATGSEFSINTVTVDNTNAFSAEESIRDIFLREDVPDVIVCLSELNTECAYQAVVDFNEVGEVNILGYYDSEAIVNAIDRDVIYSTISIDTNQLGAYSVKALSDYYEYGNTSQYYTADVTLINKNNVADYLQKEEEDD